MLEIIDHNKLLNNIESIFPTLIDCRILQRNAVFVVFKPHNLCLADIIFTIGDNDCDFWKVFALGRPLQLRVIETLLEPD